MITDSKTVADVSHAHPETGEPAAVAPREDSIHVEAERLDRGGRGYKLFQDYNERYLCVLHASGYLSAPSASRVLATFSPLQPWISGQKLLVERFLQDRRRRGRR